MVVIRKAAVNDAKAIAEYLLLAMKEIVFRFIGEEDLNKAYKFMLHFVEKNDNQYSWENCWIAEDGNKVIGAINLYDGAHLHQLRQPVIEHIRSNFNNNFAVEDETQAGEYYIDTLGVAPARQGNGIGTKLLQFVIDEYVNKRKQTLGLLVDEENLNAKRLYLKLGFKSAGIRHLFGKRMEHLQVSTVSPEKI
ncbi:GNAT family N-acetyltransferase [Chryseosolibacter indicus]|uniref:GNAT family N-acetyltransferase n=1 Tax=Chryseosolibacter indicus TaxID=2782351 RepID=A0ABS5VY98_9BACT|nr:GNAT family N-acetyltransferase [Chryseosolibacter indicus]MBT1706390.1 GNAT family N-acetyltransferase [Chryseosolibacter indicus]